MRITPAGDSALRIELAAAIGEAESLRVQSACAALDAAAIPGLTELVPAYTTLTAHYDARVVAAACAPADDLVGWLSLRVAQALEKLPAKPARKGRLVEIPVCYGGEFGPDLEAVAAHTKLGRDEIVRLHQKEEYLVYLLGFAPGFPYLGKISPKLAMPRRAAPRPSVAPGSVGIVNDQTCIYPLATPGGWNLLGRTPLRLFNPAENPPALLQSGDRVRFRAIDAAEFARLQREGKQ